RHQSDPAPGDRPPSRRVAIPPRAAQRGSSRSGNHSVNWTASRDLGRKRCAMLWWLIVIVIVCVGLLLYLRAEQNRRTARELEEAQADARVTIERLGGQVYQLTPRNEAARQALADASERYN